MGQDGNNLARISRTTFWLGTERAVPDRPHASPSQPTVGWVQLDASPNVTAAAREISAADIAAPEQVRRVFRAEVDDALTHVDALALPTLPDVPLSLAAAAD